MTIAIPTTTALAAANEKTEPITVKKNQHGVGSFKLNISGTWAGTITILRKPQQINEKMKNYLVHTGSAAAAAITAGAAVGVVADELIGMWIRNVNTNSFGPITDNTATVITATQAGGSDTKWDVGEIGDLWEVVGTYTANQVLIGEEAEDNAQYVAIFSARTSGTARVAISR